MIALDHVKEEVANACARSSRHVNSVVLVAVSKTKPINAISSLLKAGQSEFGENKLQELEVKAPALSSSIEWHYIGRIQKNKIRKILQHTNWIHSVDSLKTLLAINRIAEEERTCPSVFLQVNIDEEESKGGFSLSEIEEAVNSAASLSHLTLAGLMCIPKPQDHPELVRPSFKKLALLQTELREKCSINMPYLSMGMSNDYSIAIEEGATHIRVGSALFGARK